MAETLRIQSAEMRLKRTQATEEKAAKLPRLTEEEIRQRREEEYAPRGRAIAELILRGDLPVDRLDVELSRYGGDEGEIVQGAFLTSLCQAIDLENAEAATRAFEGLYLFGGSRPWFRICRAAGRAFFSGISNAG